MKFFSRKIQSLKIIQSDISSVLLPPRIDLLRTNGRPSNKRIIHVEVPAAFCLAVMCQAIPRAWCNLFSTNSYLTEQSMPCIWSSSAIHLDGSHSRVFWIGKECKAPRQHWHSTVRREEFHCVRKTIHLVLVILVWKQFAWSDCPCQFLGTCDPHTLIPTASVQFSRLSYKATSNVPV